MFCLCVLCVCMKHNICQSSIICRSLVLSHGQKLSHVVPPRVFDKNTFNVVDAPTGSGTEYLYDYLVFMCVVEVLALSMY